ncbi:hypothetical protein ACFYXL_14315 [Streptomyces tsukubensis]|uniref:hypothetical protein n=1 Tax=Streptomyces tsukubensis TaxID=83656 RepID=UPI00369180F2
MSLGRWRQRTKDADVLRVLLWLEGFPITTDAVRSAVVADLRAAGDALQEHINPSLFADGVPEQVPRETVESFAAGLAARRGPKAVPRPVRQPADERARSVELMLRAFGLGETVTATDGEAFAVERLLGVSAGRRQKVHGVGPWLTGSPQDLFAAAPAVALPALAEAMATVTDTDLEEARPVAHALFFGMPLVARLIGTVHGKDNHAGFGGIARLDEEPTAALWMVAMGVALRRMEPETAGNLAAIHSALRALPGAMADIMTLLEMPQAALDQNLAGHSAAVQLQVLRVVEAALEGKFESGLDH